jgi:DNA-binding response OmpR family regulator
MTTMEKARRPRTILLAETDAGTRRLVCAMLSRKNHIVLEASSGAEALRISRRLYGRIDLLITNMTLLGMTGPHLARRLRQDRPELRVIFICNERPEYDPVLFRSGIGLVCKPLSRAGFLREVHRILRPSPGRRMGEEVSLGWRVFAPIEEKEA